MKSHDNAAAPEYNDIKLRNFIYLFLVVFLIAFSRNIHLPNGHSLFKASIYAFRDGTLAAFFTWALVNISNLTTILFKKQSLSQGRLVTIFAVSASYFILFASAGL
jgi:hypothetical protein